MGVFAIGIKLANDVQVQCPHDANAREHRRPAVRRDQDQGLHRRLPLRGGVLGLRQLGDEIPGVLQRDELAAVRRHNRIVEATLPVQSSTPPRNLDRKIQSGKRFGQAYNQLFQEGVAFMIDALFWYTGLAVWVLIVFGCVSTLVIEAHDRSVMRH
jgi:hypothetical protein